MKAALPLLLAAALARQPKDALTPRAPHLALDRHYILAAAGLLATADQAAARRLLHENVLAG